MSSLVNPEASYSSKIIPGDKFWPNNNSLQTIVYRHVLQAGDNSESEVKDLLEKNGWSNAWTGTVFNYHHYHSNAHEVLAVLKGSCMLEVGGLDGNIQNLAAGDVIVLPAGVVHKLVGSTEDFSAIGAYPGGGEYDVQTDSSQREQVDENIKNVQLPEKDPIYGETGPVKELWHGTGSEEAIKKDRTF